MRIEYLQEYLVVASVLNLSKAATELHTSVSALSKHMTSIEKELGVKLLRRTTTQVTLTAAGRQFLEDTLTIGDQYDRAIERLGALSHPSGGNLRIVLGVRTPALLKSATQAKADMESAHVAVDYSTPAFRNYYESAEQPEIDAVVTYATRNIPSHLEVIELKQDPWVAIVPNSHPLAASKRVSLVDDLSEHAIIRLKGTFFKAGFDTIAEAFEDYGVKPRSRYSVVSSFDDLNLNPDFTSVLILPSGSLGMLTCISPVTHTILTFKEDLSFKLSLVFQESKRSDRLITYSQALKTRLENIAKAK